MLTVDIIGLRDLLGRFASMRDHELAAIQMEEASGLATVIEDVYRRHAPRSRGLPKDKPRHFFEGLTAHASMGAKGFEIQLATDEPQLRRWLAEGTPPHLILPRRPAYALFWPHATHPVARVHHPGTKANRWEQAAYDEVRGVVDVAGSRIGKRVTAYLAGSEGV